MPGLQGYGLTQTVDSEIVAAYAASQGTIPAVTTEPGWTTAGAFQLPKGVTARLEVIACVSDDVLTGVARLWNADPEVEEEVAGSRATFTSVILEETVRSGSFEIAAGRYLVQVQVTGDEGDDMFAMLRTASLVGP